MPVQLATGLPVACMSMRLTPGLKRMPWGRTPAAEPSMTSFLREKTDSALLICSDASGVVPPSTSSRRMSPVPAARVRFFAPSTVFLKVMPLALSWTSPASASAPRITGPFQVCAPEFVTSARSRIAEPLTVRFGEPIAIAPPAAAFACSMTGRFAASPMTRSLAITRVNCELAVASRCITWPGLALRMERVVFANSSPEVELAKV